MGREQIDIATSSEVETVSTSTEQGTVTQVKIRYTDWTGEKFHERESV